MFHLKLKPRPPHVRRTGDERPGGGFLRDHQRVGETAEYGFVQPPKKGDRFQILVVAVDVGNPFSRALVVVEIEPWTPPRPRAVRRREIRRRRIPRWKSGRRRLLPSRSRISASPHPRFSFRSHWEGSYSDSPSNSYRPNSSLGKCAGTQSRMTPMSAAWKGVDERHEIVRRAQPGSDRVIAGHLVSPGAVVRMLLHGHEFDVGIAMSRT